LKNIPVSPLTRLTFVFQQSKGRGELAASGNLIVCVVVKSLHGHQMFRFTAPRFYL